MAINTNEANIILKSSGRINLINENVDYNGNCDSVLLSTRIL
jgi:galactokinase